MPTIGKKIIKSNFKGQFVSPITSHVTKTNPPTIHIHNHKQIIKEIPNKSNDNPTRIKQVRSNLIGILNIFQIKQPGLG
jgi:hypothetical protein